MQKRETKEKHPCSLNCELLAMAAMGKTEKDKLNLFKYVLLFKYALYV